jgi:hypothetical protein
MPALAIAMALLWDKLAKPWYWITLAIAVPALVMLARIGWVMGDLRMSTPPQVAMVLIAACAGLTGAGVGFSSKIYCKTSTLVACLAVYFTFGMMVQPFGDDSANYSSSTLKQVQGQRIAVPNGFTGQFERFHFVFPESTLTPYDAQGRNTGAFQPELPPAQRLPYLLEQFDAVVWLQDNLDETTPSCAPGCKIIGERLHVKSRHKSGEVTLDNLWFPQTWLFGREWLVMKVPR